MYKVFYVEDEYLAREHVKKSNLWVGDKYELCGIAANGKEAWDILQNIECDILITDIQMPFMDGLELSRLVRTHMPHIKIIILSGYSEFEYAKNAMNIGVEDYHLKPSRSSLLLETLDKVANKIEMERLTQKKLTSFDAMVQNNIKLSTFKLLDEISTGIFSLQDIDQRITKLNIDFYGRFYISIIIDYFKDDICHFEDDIIQILDVRDIIFEYILDKPNVFAFNKSIRHTYIIVKGNNPTQLLLDTTKFVHDIYHYLKNKNFHPIISVGSIRDNITGISDSFSEAQLLLNYIEEMDAPPILMYNKHFSKITENFSIALSFVSEKSLLKNLLYYGNMDDVCPVMTKLSSKIKALNLSYDLYIYTCNELVNCITDFISDIGGDLSEISLLNQFMETKIVNSNSWIEKINTIDDFMLFLKDLTNNVIEYREKKKDQNFDNVIAASIKYINEHYSDPELRLSTLSTMVSLSDSYFSALFKQEVGITFIEYLTNTRIQKAQKLLKTTGKLTTEIAYDVGYQDSNYFSKIFKKITGQSPRSYRKST